MMVELSILPIGKDVHLGKYVAEAVKIVHDSGIEYRLTPMGTLLIGDWESVMNVVRACHEAVRQRCDRVVTKIKIDDLKGEEKLPEEKVQSVERLLNFSVKK
ncbi:MAG: MTH1187 family thiamine-binding protein [bacterium]